jgi:hypothetical protein
MKAKLTLLFAMVLVVLPWIPPVSSQPPTDKPARHLNVERRARWASLSEEERQKVRTAHQQAMADPVVKAAHDRLKQARKEFRDIMRPAMVRADPSVQPLLEKLCPEHANGQ